MGKNYKNPMSRLNEARTHYKGLLNEAPGFPGMCCDGGPDCIPVTFSSANDDCSTLMMDDCGHADCMGDIGPGGPIGLDDLDLEVDDSDNELGNSMVSCDFCDNGSPVSQMFPGPNCPPNMIPSGTGDPCDGITPTSDPCAFPDISGPCATQANLASQFVSGDPTQFLSNMLSWYTNPPNPMNYPYHRGCNFLEIVRQKHLGHLSTGIVINNNNPTPGVQMGPAWIAQKTAKVAYLDCVLAALNADNCCGSPSNPNGGSTGTGTGTPDQPIMSPMMGQAGGDTKSLSSTPGKRGTERKGMRK
jgi:hypothetical protein